MVYSPSPPAADSLGSDDSAADSLGSSEAGSDAAADEAGACVAVEADGLAPLPVQAVATSASAAIKVRLRAFPNSIMKSLLLVAAIGSCWSTGPPLPNCCRSLVVAQSPPC